MAKAANAEIIVDSTFASPLVMRPLEFGATYTVHSLTKYLSGHGDVLAGIVIAERRKVDIPSTTLARARPGARAV